MKKFCFVHFYTYSSKNQAKHKWTLNPDRDIFQELPISFRKFLKFEQVHYDFLDKDTSLFISMESFHQHEHQVAALKNELRGRVCKNIFIDFSTYDNQDIPEVFLDELETISDVPIFFITKNLISKRDNHFWFEVLFAHYVENTSANYDAFSAFRRIEREQTNFLRKYKGMFHVGHSRYHKIKFLNFLHENDYLKDLLWASTAPDYDSGLMNELVPQCFRQEFDSFPVLKILPHFYDYSGYSHYRQRGNSFNFVTYLDTYFEIATETKFFHVQNQGGMIDTQSTWNNITEKVLRPTFVGHPFILLSKPNTISALEKLGLQYRYDFWDHAYDSIEDDVARFCEIEKFTKKVFELDKKELAEFKREYNIFTGNNFRRMYVELFSEQILRIYEAA